MSNDVGGLHHLSTKKAAVTKVGTKQHVNFKPRGSVICKQVCQVNSSYAVTIWIWNGTHG